MDKNLHKGFWELKPYWCQPWSIISVGILVLIFSWKFFYNPIITFIVFLFIVSWWILFLILVPRSYQKIDNKNN